MLAAGCAPLEHEDERERVEVPSQAITNGAPDLAHDSTVRIPLRAGTCSGTLISPHVVVTAAHCLAEGTPHEVASAGGSTAPIRVGLAMPTFDETTLRDDLAVLVLTRSLPVSAATFGAAPEHGDTVTVVGYSGGAAYVTRDGHEILVGVISHGDARCERRTHFTRVDGQSEAFLRELVVRDDQGLDPLVRENPGGCSAAPARRVRGRSPIGWSVAAFAARAARAAPPRTPRTGVVISTCRRRRPRPHARCRARLPSRACSARR